MKPAHKDRFRISEEAALWLVRLEDDASAEMRAEFTAWARQSPVHVEEFLFAQATSRHMTGMDPQRRIDLSAMDAESGAVVPMVKGEEARLTAAPAPSAERRVGRKRMRGALAALAASIALAAGAWFVLGSGTQTYSTVVGDQQTIKLPDGSVMHLNTASRAEVRFTGREREVRLLSGEALFVVARDPARPFRVASGDAAIQVLGTQFNVYRRDHDTRISVIDGAVSVSSEAAPGVAPLELVAGDQADVARGEVVKADNPDVEKAIAWRARRLVFEADPLEEAALEFNRYGHRQPIRLEGDAVHRRTISGVFDADDPAPLIGFLEEDPALSVTRTDKEIVVRMR